MDIYGNAAPDHMSASGIEYGDFALPSLVTRMPSGGTATGASQQAAQQQAAQAVQQAVAQAPHVQVQQVAQGQAAPAQQGQAQKGQGQGQQGQGQAQGQAQAAAPSGEPAVNPSLATGVFVLYLLISAGYLSKLLGCRIQALLADSMPLAHALGYATLLFFVTLTGPGRELSFAAAAAASAGLYAWFMATTRMTVGTWGVMMAALAAAYALGAYREATYKTPEERASAGAGRVARAQAVLVACAAAATGVGALLYAGMKRLEYGDAFRWSTFVLGKPACRHTSPEVPASAAFKAAFGFVE